jgi:hypothetical protein
MADMALEDYAEKGRLLADYRYVVQVWSDSVSALRDHAGRDDFALQMEVVDKA